MSKKEEQPLKEVFDYKEPFQAPYMVREITKRVKLKNAVSAQTIFVGGVTALGMFLIFYLFFGVSQFSIFPSGLIAFGMVELFNRIEPDGKKVHVYLKDLLKYIYTYQVKKQVIQQGKFIQVTQKETVYDRVTVDTLLVKTKKKHS